MIILSVFLTLILIIVLTIVLSKVFIKYSNRPEGVVTPEEKLHQLLKKDVKYCCQWSKFLKKDYNIQFDYIKVRTSHSRYNDESALYIDEIEISVIPKTDKENIIKVYKILPKLKEVIKEDADNYIEEKKKKEERIASEYNKILGSLDKETTLLRAADNPNLLIPVENNNG